jgi:hypothetical protein
MSGGISGYRKNKLKPPMHADPMGDKDKVSSQTASAFICDEICLGILEAGSGSARLSCII